MVRVQHVEHHERRKNIGMSAARRLGSMDEAVQIFVQQVGQHARHQDVGASPTRILGLLQGGS